MCTFHFFLFERNIFNGKTPETKHSYLWNGSQLASLTAHLSSRNFCLMKTLFPFQNYCKIVFVQLISNQNDMFSICTKVQIQLKKTSSKLIWQKSSLFVLIRIQSFFQPRNYRGTNWQFLSCKEGWWRHNSWLDVARWNACECGYWEWLDSSLSCNRV